jgi:hypothetical protein
VREGIEVAPEHLAATLVDCLLRLRESGVLFLFANPRSEIRVSRPSATVQ